MKTSVAMCTYNGAAFIKEQLDSILNQTTKVNEIVVCDDGSTDDTIKILKIYEKENPGLFSIYQNEVNLRSVKNFEKAIQLCTGDIIFLSDQDDMWVKEKVEVYVNYFKKNEHIDALASNGYCIDEHSIIHEKYAIWDVPNFLRERNVEFDYYSLITQIGNFATGASMAFRKKIIPKIIPFPILKDFHHDEWIALQTAKNDAFELLPDKYFKYRIHNTQQVGGVFFKKSKSVRQILTNIYDLKNYEINFKSFKKRIKNLIVSYNRQYLLFEFYNYQNAEVKQNLLIIEDEINANQSSLKQKYPLKTIMLNKSDQFLNKRQFKPFQF